MAYTKNPTWQDYDGADDTLITAAKLNHLEDGVEAAAAAADGASQPGHTHDDRYFTEAEVTASLAGKAAGVGVSTVWAGSQAAYDAIGTPDPNTLYFVTG